MFSSKYLPFYIARTICSIYTIQDHGLAFKNVSALLYAMHPKFPSLLQQSTRQHLLSTGLGPLIVDELVTAALLANYAQTTDVQAFVGRRYLYKYIK